MAKFDNPLENLKIASPCPADWNAMSGDERKRFCGDCKKNVYNLSGMTRYDAENLLRNSEGEMCVRYFQRADGTILTADCPVGWAKVRDRLTIFATAALSMVLAILSGLFYFGINRRGDIARFDPIPVSTPQYYPTMGAIAAPSPSPTPKKATPKGKTLVYIGNVQGVD